MTLRTFSVIIFGTKRDPPLCVDDVFGNTKYTNHPLQLAFAQRHLIHILSSAGHTNFRRNAVTRRVN